MHELFNNLFSLKVLRIDYDVINRQLLMELLDEFNGNVQTITFNEVKSFTYLNDNHIDISSYFSIEDFINDNVSFSLIKSKNKRDKKWLQQFSFTYNIIIEGFNNSLLIKCKSIKYNETIINCNCDA